MLNKLTEGIISWF